MNINKYAKEIHKQTVARGWWDDPERCLFTVLQLINTEIAEATEGDRSSLADAHLPHRSSAEVELADALIRLLDLAGYRKWKYTPTQPSPRIQLYASLPMAHFFLTLGVGVLGLHIFLEKEKQNMAYSALVQDILYVVEREKYDLWGAVKEKLKYNQRRADHDKENRAKPRGKRY